MQLCLIASLLSPFFIEVTPEVRTTYVSLGKLLEDRPMQVTSVKLGYDTELFGRIGVRNWDVSSLTDRRSDVHRHTLYHTEWGPIWQYDWQIVEHWQLKSELTRSWTIYDGFDEPSAEQTYHWWQLVQSLENPYIVPFYQLRRAIRTSDYFYFKLGLRRKFKVWSSLHLTPSVFIEGGNERNQRRVFGKNIHGGEWSAGVASISARLEAGWRFNDMVTAFGYVEQYEVLGNDARDTNGSSSYLCAHNDWTHGGIGVRLTF